MDDLHYKGKGRQEGSKTKSALTVIFSYIKKAIIEINFVIVIVSYIKKATIEINFVIVIQRTLKIYCRLKIYLKFYFNDSTAIAQLAVSLCVSLNVSPITTIVRCH